MKHENIHISAVIGNAEIADSVRIGPHAVVYDDVRIGPETYIGAGTIIYAGATVGEGNRIYNNVTIHEGVEIGNENTILPYSSIGTLPQLSVSEKNKEVDNLVIGHGNRIWEYVTISRGTREETKEGIRKHPTVIGNSTSIFTGTHIAHGCFLDDYVNLINNVKLGGNVHIGRNAYLSADAAVAPFMKIGNFAGIGAGTQIKKDVIPYSFIVSEGGKEPYIYFLNKVAAERAGITKEEMNNIQNFYNLLFKEDKKKETIKDFIFRFLRPKEKEPSPTLTEKFSELEKKLVDIDEIWDIACFTRESFTERNGIYTPHKGKVRFFNPVSSSNNPNKYHSVQERKEKEQAAETKSLLKEE